MMKIRSTNNRKRIAAIFSGALFLLLLLFLFGINSFEGGTEDPPPIIEEEIVVEEPIYPQRLEIEDEFIDAAAVLSVFWDREKETVLYAKNEKDILPMASISKIFTALVVWENYNTEEHIGVTEIEMITKKGLDGLRLWPDTRIREVLYPLLIESNNSAALALAMQAPRFLESGDLVEEMNKRADELGLEDTSFVNSSGLDEENGFNTSTTEDIYSAAKYVLERSELFDIMSVPYYRLYSADKTVYYTVVNTNQFLFSAPEGWGNRIVGGKTGWTSRALGCLLLVIESPKEEGYIVNIILGAEDRFEEMKKLIDFVHKAYVF